jgi:hypothetical protein
MTDIPDSVTLEWLARQIAELRAEIRAISADHAEDTANEMRPLRADFRALIEALTRVERKMNDTYIHAPPVRKVVMEPNGTVRYYSCGLLHREDGPAVIEVYPDYDGPERHRSWYRFGVLDREDGPAVVGGRTANGQYEWWRAGVRHRDDGPAAIALIESREFGPGPVYEWWRNGVRQKVQDGGGILYYFRDGETVLTELPDGCRIIERNGELRFEDPDGDDLGDPPPLEAYDGYLEGHESLNELYEEPQSTFDTFDPALDGEEKD